MKLTWYRNCHICHNPLDLMIHANSGREYDIAYTFRKFVKIDFSRNTSRLVFFNGKCRRVCTCCKKKLRNKPSIKSIFFREIGGKLQSPQSSLCHTLLTKWWKRFEEFAMRKDVEDYLLTESDPTDFDWYITLPIIIFLD